VADPVLHSLPADPVDPVVPVVQADPVDIRVAVIRAAAIRVEDIRAELPVPSVNALP
jgi:hypothetical protein